MSRPTAAANDELSPDFADFVDVLNAHRVDYLLVGGYAVGIHGVPRATVDIDFFFRPTRANVARLCAALAEFGAPPAVIDPDALMTPDVVTQFGEPPQRIDLLNAIDGVSFAQAWEGSLPVMLGGRDIRVIGLAELRANKEATGRKKDRDDARRLAAVSRTPRAQSRRRSSRDD